MYRRTNAAKMLSCIAAVALLLGLSGAVSALSVGPGGTVYWSVVSDGPSGRPGLDQIYRTTLDTDWSLITSGDNFDNIDLQEVGYSALNPGMLSKNLEVWDPTHEGGTGKLLMTATVLPPRSDFSAGNESYPWDVILVDTDCLTNNDTFSVANGNVLMPGWGEGRYNDYSTDGVYGALRTPDDWGGQENNGVGFVIKRYAADHNLIIRHDTNGDGYVDNNTTEATFTGEEWNPNCIRVDTEFGPDGALYSAWSNNSTDMFIARYYADSAGAVTEQAYVASGGVGNPIKKMGQEYGAGLAVLEVEGEAPIVYLNAKTDDEGSDRTAIFALQDGDGDNVVDYTDADDIVAVIWTDGQYGLAPSYDWIFDLEMYVNPENGTKTLLFNGGNNGALYALELADNGLAAIDGATLGGAGTVGTFFELDMNYVEGGGDIPEPGTMLLLGTGIIGVVGVIRRRRMR